MVISERHWGRWEFDTREPPALIIQSMLFCEYYILLSLCQSLSQQENWIHTPHVRKEVGNAPRLGEPQESI